MSEEEQAIVNAAIAWWEEYGNRSLDRTEWTLVQAVEAYRETKNPQRLSALYG